VKNKMGIFEPILKPIIKILSDDFIAVLALAISIFTFWWTSVRNPKKLNLVNVKNQVGMMPEFAIVNGSNKDILITSLLCVFSNNIKKQSTTPLQNIKCEESECWLLKSNSAFHCKVFFPEPFTSAFAKEGIYDEDKKIYFNIMHIEIAWVEMNGKYYNKTKEFIKYGFRESGQIAQYNPFVKQVNLYK
jgi:hypothetical protein